MAINKILEQNPLVLAPMAGVTDLPFRIICREMGAGLVFSEMISAEALCRHHPATASMLQSDPRERPVAFQIFGGRPESMAKAARILSEAEIDIIDINMGCPVPKVIKSGAGSAILRDTALAQEIIAAVVESSSLPVTVKMRLGWDHKNLTVLHIAQSAETLGVAAVTIHGRTRSQGFGGNADWQMLRIVKESVSIPVIGNGDVCSGADAKRMMDETGCDGVMIGRASRGNPWIFREATSVIKHGVNTPPPATNERKEIMLRHLREMVEALGEMKGVQEMRKHLCWYSKGLKRGAEFRQRVTALARIEDVVHEIERYLDDTAV